MARTSHALLATLLLTGTLQAQPTPTADQESEFGMGNVSIPHTTATLVSDSPSAGILLPAGRIWASAEYLRWWVQGDRLPPLVTTGSPTTTPGQAGVLGVPGTGVLFGDDRINDGPRNGVRLSLGLWLDDCHLCGVGVEVFDLDGLNDGFTGSSAGIPVLARPVFNTATGLPDAQLAAFPGIAQSTLTVSSDSRLWGAGAFGRKAFCIPCDNVLVGGLMGYRYLDLDETVQIDEALVAVDQTPGAPPPGTVFTLTDTYRTRNQFHGADVGLTARLTAGRCFVDVLGKVAVGCNVREYTVGGWSETAVPGLPPTNSPGGLYTIGLAGTRTDQVFAVVPELRVNVGYQVCNNLNVFAGYSVLGWTNVARPGDQIDLYVDPAQLPPALVPVGPRPFEMRDTTLWLQGLNVGVAVSF